MINHDFYTFVTNGNFSDYNISIYEKDHNISDKQLLKNSFKFLFLLRFIKFSKFFLSTS